MRVASAPDWTLGRRRLRLFAGPVDEPRARRASDVIALAASLLGLGVLGVAANPAPRFEVALASLLGSLPGFLDSVWALLVGLPWLAAVLTALAVIARRRWALARDLMIAVGLAIGMVYVAGQLVESAWPALEDLVRSTAWPFPGPPLAVSGAVIVTAGPHLARPIRQWGTWSLWAAALAAPLLAAATPLKSLAGVLVAIAAGSVVHLVFGSVRGRPGLDDVDRALADLGISARALGVAGRQEAGEFVVDTEDSDGRPLIVKVYGRDAYETQLLATAWRAAWYRETVASPALGRLHQVEHEALLTLLAAQGGVPTYEVVTAGAAQSGDALLVLREVGAPLPDGEDAWTAETMSMMWAALRRLHLAGVAHGQVDGPHMFRTDDGGGPAIGLLDFRSASIGADPLLTWHDQAQLFVASVLGGEEGTAIDAARSALGDDGVGAMLPLVQSPVLTPVQRRSVRAAGLDLDDLRQRAADAIGLPPPELQRLRRVTAGTLLQMGLLVFAFLALARVVGGVDFVALGEEVADADWWLVAVGFLVAQVPRLAHAVSALGASPIRVVLGPLYALQLATAYLSLVIPSAAGRIALNVRFFQRQGLQRGTAVAVGALDGFAGFLVQVSTVILLLVFTSTSLDLDLDLDPSAGVVRLLLTAIVLALIGGCLVLLIPGVRHRTIDQVRTLWAEARQALRGISSPRRLGMLLGGNLASDVFLALSLGAFTLSLGYSVGLGELIMIVVSVSLLAGIMPVPGGIGVTEGGLIFGLVSAGLPEEAAFAAVIVYRAASFYLPPIWGFFALKWLERNEYI